MSRVKSRARLGGAHPGDLVSGGAARSAFACDEEGLGFPRDIVNLFGLLGRDVFRMVGGKDLSRATIGALAHIGQSPVEN